MEGSRDITVYVVDEDSESHRNLVKQFIWSFLVLSRQTHAFSPQVKMGKWAALVSVGVVHDSKLISSALLPFTNGTLFAEKYTTRY